MTAYDDSNIFAKMLRGEIPAHKVYEDADVLVTMDIFPQSRGHVLVIPKAPSRNLLDADPGRAGRGDADGAADRPCGGCGDQARMACGSCSTTRRRRGSRCSTSTST